MTTTSDIPMTAAEFLAMPEDGTSRELIRGELRVSEITTHPLRHAAASGRLTFFQSEWLDRQHNFAGIAGAGGVGCWLAKNPDTVVEIDIAIFIGEAAFETVERNGLYDHSPHLAVEILAPTDTHCEVVEKVQLYREAGVPQTWVVDPDLQTVSIYRPDKSVVMFDRHKILPGEPELPGFQVHVSQLFQGKRSDKP